MESVRLRDWKKLIKPPPGNHKISNGTDSNKMTEFATNNGCDSRARAAVEEKNLANCSSNGHIEDVTRVCGADDPTTDCVQLWSPARGEAQSAPRSVLNKR